MNELDPKVALRLQQAINQQLDELVRQATRTTLLLKGSDMEESQLRNLVNVAQESRSVEVVANFIRYQIARNKSAWGLNLDGFGHTVIADLYNKVKQLAEQATQVAQEALSQESRGPKQVQSIQKQAHVTLMLLYLGYLNRAFYFAKKTGGSGGFPELARALTLGATNTQPEGSAQ